MSVLELPKDALLGLTDVQLEQLIGRLSEAEAVANGALVSDVRFSGSITAPDGGVDIRVVASSDPFSSGFIPRFNTVFQSKKDSMGAAAIAGEMRPKNVLLPAISKQCDLSGAYIIVSLEDDCSETMRTSRLQAMEAAVGDHPKRNAIHLDFYDRFKLHQWLRQHPGIMLWVRNELGQPLSGWQPHGRWSHVPHGTPDDLIMEPGVSVILPIQQHQRLTLEDAITPTRDLIVHSRKAIRVAGLSGVGKTRLVQALFDETVGENALDRTSVVYTDTGADPDPSARKMIDQLVQGGRKATVVVDNCPPALHADLASRVSSTTNDIKLITVEYDIRDDKPQTTEVILIEAHGPEIAEALVQRRFPQIGQTNARRVAEFSDGNTRVALALAERVEAEESLALLSDTNLFDRLFQQRHEPDGVLRNHAEVLSLAYSFAVEEADGEPDELAVLGSLCGATTDQLYQSAQVLLERQVVQRRGRWRAILPQAIANKLAKSVLGRMRVQTVKTVFENPANPRLLKSFAHRLGLMHDHPVAQQIVAAWLAHDGLLVPVTSLDDEKFQILEFIAPVCPELLLDRIEAEILAPEFTGMEIRFNRRRTTTLKILVSLAYEPEMFDRCIALLLRIAESEDPSNNYDSVRDKIVQFFQPYLSGTHATIDQRAKILRSALWSSNLNRRALGARMLGTALDGPSWTGMGMGEFGARPRNFGFEPNHQQLAEWRETFIGISLEAGMNDDAGISDCARRALAQEFRGLWQHVAIREALTTAATTLNDQRPWTDGWKAVQSTIFFDCRRNTGDPDAEPTPPELIKLRDLLTPTDLVSNIRAHLFGSGQDLWSLDPDFDHDDTAKYREAETRIAAVVSGFGEAFANQEREISELGPELFTTSWMPFGRAFGEGLASGSSDIPNTWLELVSSLQDCGGSNFNCAVLAGFIEEAGRINQGLDRKILDSCLDDPLLRPITKLLHPAHDFDDADLERCLKALEYPDVNAWTFGDLLWRREYSNLDETKLLDLAGVLLAKRSGDQVVLDALSMKLHDTDLSVDTLGNDLRAIGLSAAINRISVKKDGSTDRADYDMARVMRAALPREGNDDLKASWLDAIFSYVDQHYGFSPDFDEAIQVTAATMPEAFLARVFSGDDTQRRFRLYFLEHGGYRKSVMGATDIGRIIGWCRTSNDPTIWEGIAGAVDLFVTFSGERSVTISDAGRQLLEASPNPDQVLRVYAGRITPNSWSDSRAAIMERNREALATFTNHMNPEIASSTIQIMADSLSWIEKERERERRDDEANEQKFE